MPGRWQKIVIMNSSVQDLRAELVSGIHPLRPDPRETLYEANRRGLLGDYKPEKEGQEARTKRKVKNSKVGTSRRVESSAEASLGDQEDASKQGRILLRLMRCKFDDEEVFAGQDMANDRFWGSKSGCNESDVKPSWKDIEKAKACMLAKAQASEASFKAKVEACGSKGRGTLEVESDVNLLYDVMYIEIIEISSDSSEDRKGASKATAPIFYGPSTQGLLDAYGYNTIEEYLSWNYFPSTDNESTDMETTDKRNTDKDCIVDSNSAMSKGKYVPVCKKHKPNMYSHVPVTGSVLGLPNVTTWDEIEKKMGARKSKTCADKAKGKRKVSCGS
ncbi:hypothetical protein Tco_1101656 [Tanacetum coccineum]